MTATGQWGGGPAEQARGFSARRCEEQVDPSTGAQGRIAAQSSPARDDPVACCAGEKVTAELVPR